MKKITLIMAIALVASVLLTGNARALPAFDQFYMVTSTGSTTAQPFSTYDLATTPVVYAHLSSAIDVKVSTAWAQMKIGGTNFYFEEASSDGQNFWLSPTAPTWAALSANQRIGNWEVGGWYTTDQGETCPNCGSTSFTVTPEPMSMVLYGMGGLPLAAHFLRRRKVAA